MTGERIAHYQVIEQLGRGGMGVVYRAKDLKLGREVALKLLPDGFGTDTAVLERFALEARSAAALNHPHICTIYEIGDHDGRPFIAMEILEGQTLAERIAARPLTIGLSIDFALQMVSALEAAHAKGIVHRDVKPANIFITSAGSAKILDFGLAKSTSAVAPPTPNDATVAASANLTGAGSTLGTIAYMSPEQARGQDLDGRSDIFSLGLVLYEMVTGRQAFRGETTALIFDGILNRTPPAPSELNSDVPPDLERVIAKAIEKDREVRYPSGAALAADLRLLKRRGDSGVALAQRSPGDSAATTAAAAASGTQWPSVASHPAAATSASPSARRWGWKAPAVAAVVIVAAVAAWQLRGPSQTLGDADVILIADFGNTTGDPVFDGTLKQALALKLEESPFLNVLSDQRVRETLAFMSRPGDTAVTHALAREICQRQGIKAALLGDIATLGNTYVITLRAENCESGDVLAREQATAASKEQVLASLGEIASSMRGRLGESLASIARNDKPIEQATTSSLEALKAFSVGDEKRNTGGDLEAVPFFRRAIELDPEFALAHARLGTVYGNRGQHALSVQHRKRAYELRDRVSERERLYISGHYYSSVTGEPDKALETYDVWKQTYPRDATPYNNSGIIYARRGEAQRALDAYIKAVELDPRLRPAYNNAIAKSIELNRLDDARALVERQMAMLGETPDTHLSRYQIAIRKNDHAAADRHAAVLENGPLAMDFVGLRREEMVFHGKFREFQRLAARQVELLKREGLTERVGMALGSHAVAAALLGEAKQARAAAESATGDSPDIVANLAVTYALLGDEALARRHFRNLKIEAWPDAQVRTLVTETFNALLALHTKRPGDMVERLETLPMDKSHPVRMIALHTRAAVHQRIGRFADAERDYRALLKLSEPLRFNLFTPLAHVGLARTLVAQGKTADARAEYQKFLDLWKDGDPDLLLLRDAKTEIAKLGS